MSGMWLFLMGRIAELFGTLTASSKSVGAWCKRQNRTFLTKIENIGLLPVSDYISSSVTSRALFCINSRLGSTLSPIKTVNISSASTTSSTLI